MPDRRVDPYARDRIDKIARSMHRAIKWLIIAFIISIVGCLAIYMRSNHLNSERINDNKDRIDDIQKSRRESIVTACIGLNMRHDKTLKKLDELLAETKRENPKRYAEAKANRARTIALIEALVPKEDCNARANRLLRTHQRRPKRSSRAKDAG